MLSFAISALLAMPGLAVSRAPSGLPRFSVRRWASGGFLLSRWHVRLKYPPVAGSHMRHAIHDGVCYGPFTADQL